MNPGRFLLAFVLPSSLLFGASAQQIVSTAPQPAQPVQRDPQAVAVLQSALAALAGGGQPVPTSITVAGTYTQFAGSSSTTYQVRLMALGFDKLRWETDLPTGTVVSIVRGRGGWIQDVEGTKVLSVADTVGQGAENLPLLALAKWATSPNVLVRLVGTESSAGANVYHISLTESHDPTAAPDSEKLLRTVRQCELYIDQQTNLPISLRYNEYLGDWRRSMPVQLVFSDYRPVNGLLFPFTLTRYHADQIASQTRLNSVVLNPPLTDDLFWVNQP